MAASHGLEEVFERRSRSVGLGRLLAWELLEDAAPQSGSRSGHASPDASLVSDGLDPVITRRAPGVVDMAFGQIAVFRIDFGEQTIALVAVHDGVDRATIAHLMDDHVAPRIIAAEGLLVLHGSAALIGGRIAVFIGKTGAGKSTFAASFHAAGHRLLGDDAVVLSLQDGVIMAESVYPSLRLYRESIEQVFGEPVRTSSMAFYSEKLHVTADLETAAHESFPLGAIYILTEGDEGVSLDRISPSYGCMAMVENSFTLDPHDAAAAAMRMAQAASIAADIPCYELAYPYDFGLLGEARAQVIASLAPTPLPA